MLIFVCLFNLFIYVVLAFLLLLFLDSNYKEIKQKYSENILENKDRFKNWKSLLKS